MGRGSDIWRPTYVQRFERAIDGCSTKVAIVQTDAGRAYLKALGNPEGPHALAREWLGTSLARWFGLVTFDFAIVQIEPGIEVPLGSGYKASPGSAFVTRAEAGAPWSGSKGALKHIVNLADVTRLVVLDTWLLNADRYPPPGFHRGPNRDNVFLSFEGRPKNPRLIAMDFTECLKSGSALNTKIGTINYIKDERIYGLFPEFAPYIDSDVFKGCLGRLDQVTSAEVAEIVEAIPTDWEVSREIRDAIRRFLTERAQFLIEHLPEALRPYLEQQVDLP